MSLHAIRNLRIAVQGKRSSWPKTICHPRKLEDILSKAPPRIEVVDRYEVYWLGKKGQRWKRICGEHNLIPLPTFVPDDMPNPFNVKNPREEYRCTNPAMSWPGISGRMGPCEAHAKRMSTVVKDIMTKRITESIKHMAEHNSEDIISGSSSLQERIEKVQDSMTIEELLDGTRLLFEMEALREMAKEEMEDTGYDQERAEHIAMLMSQQTEMRLKMTKTDNELLKNQALSTVLRVILNGVLSIIEERIGPEQAAAIFEEFKKTLIIPITEQGYSEVLRRQQAAGISEPIELTANQFKVIEENV